MRMIAVLLRGGVPWNEIARMDETETFAWFVTFRELDGESFDWDCGVWREPK